MKELLKITNLHHTIEESTLFKASSLNVKNEEIIGLIGKNGAGKSMLLQLIAGKAAPADGTLDWKQAIEPEFVEQEQAAYDNQSITAAERELLAKLLVPLKDYEQLSGGEKLKARLARGFSKGSPLLLLDEPSNHLDEKSIHLLIELIRQYDGAVIIVSHDRYLLDEAATKIWSIENKEITEFEGNYSAYMAFRSEQRKAQEHAYFQQQKKIRHVEKQMDNLSSWSDKAHRESTKQEGAKEHYRMKAKKMDAQVKSKRKKLEKELEKERIEELKPEYAVEFSLPKGRKRGKRLIEVENLDKRHGNQLLFEKVHLTVQSGEKIALVGPNGSGKTTFLNILMGRENTDEGSCWVSPSADIGYLTQQVFDLPLDQTLEQFFYRETFEERGKVQNLMKHLGFHASQWTEAIGDLSMGERVKCKLMHYILEAKDILILDEPTNHLDLPSREQLEQTLSEYPGTVIAVSHDRYFIDKITDKTWIIENRQIHTPMIKTIADDAGLYKMRLENEQQEILGKLSLLTPKDIAYEKLDKRFNEILKALRELKAK